MKDMREETMVYKDLKDGSLIEFTVHYENGHGDAMSESLHYLMKKYELNSIREFNARFEYVASAPIVPMVQKNKKNKRRIR